MSKIDRPRYTCLFICTFVLRSSVGSKFLNKLFVVSLLGHKTNFCPLLLCPLSFM